MTFGTLKTTIIQHLNRDDLTLVIPQWINWAMRRIERQHNLRYMLSSSTSGVSSGAKEMTEPTRTKDIVGIYIADSGDDNYKMMEHVERERIEGQRDLANGKAEQWARYGVNIEYDRTLNATYPQRIVYFAYTADMTADSDEDWLATNASDVLVFGALAYSAPVSEGDPRLAVWAGFYKDALNSLIKSQSIEDLDTFHMELEVTDIMRRRYDYNVQDN